MAGPFDDLIPKKTAKSLEAGDVLRSFASGVGMGYADELSAAFDATLPIVGKTLAKVGLVGGGQSEAPDWSARYAENLARERGIDKRIAEDHPYIDATAKAAGGVAGTVAALPAFATAIGPSAIANVAKATGTGMALGGAAGFGEGEGLSDRLTRAGVGATLGGAFGAAQRPLAAVGQSLLESAPGRMVANSAVGGAAERIATALQRSKKDVPAVDMELARLGNEATLSDVSPTLLQLGVNAKTLPGETRQIAQDFFAPREGVGRIGRTGQRMVQAAEGGEAIPTHYAAQQGMDAERSTVGNQVYGAMRGAEASTSPEMDALKQVPAVRDALAQIEQDAANTGTTLTPIEVMHRVKQKLNDTAEAAFASGKPINKADMRDLAGKWEQAFWQANPAAHGADQAYAKVASLPDYYGAGSSLFSKGLGDKATNSSAPAIADLLSNATPGQAQAARYGGVNAIRDKAQTLTGARGMARDIEFGAGDNGLQGKINQLFPADRAADITRQAKTEGIFANTANRYLGGPHTADDLIGAGDLGNIAVRATPGGGVVPRITETAKALVNWVASPNEQVRNKIGAALLTDNPAKQKETLKMIAEILAKRRAGMPLRAGLSEAAGAAGGNF